MKKYLLLIVSVLLLTYQSKSMSVTFYNSLDDACNEGIGFIEASVSGGVAPYTFQWSGGTVTSTGNSSKCKNLTAGTYVVSVYDALGDSATNSFSIINYSSLDRGGLVSAGIYSAVDPVAGSYVGHPCPDQSNGVLFGHLEFTGGASPFNSPSIISMNNVWTGQINTGAIASINTGPNGEFIQINNLVNGDIFTIGTSDALGCLGNFDGHMYGPFNYSSNIITTLPACNGLANGSVLLDNFSNNPWPLTVSLFDSATNALIATQTNMFPPSNISCTILAGIYRIKLTYDNTFMICDTNYYITVVDAGFSCGTISGKIYLDTIHNCTADVNEPGVPSQIITLSPGPYYASSDTNGNYSLTLPFGTYTLSQLVQNYYGYNQNFFPVCNASAFTINNGTPTAVRNIGDSTNMQYDLSIGITAGSARPGFNLRYDIDIKNYSFVTGSSPLVTFTVDPSLVFVSCSYPSTDLGGGVYTVQLGSITSFQHIPIHFYFTVPASSVIGTTLTAIASVADVISETNTANNSDTYSQIIVGSFDPNDKSVWPSRDINNTYFVDIDSVLTYTIRFQNTGTDTAFNIRIADTLSQWLDINSLSVESSSHPMT